MFCKSQIYSVIEDNYLTSTKCNNLSGILELIEVLIISLANFVSDWSGAIESYRRNQR